MRHDYEERDITDAMRKGLWASIACTVLVVSVVALSPIEIPDDYLGAPPQPSAHRSVQAPPAPAPQAVAAGSSWYHDAPFVTDRGGSSEPDPLPQ